MPLFDIKVEHENGSYNAWALKVNVGNSVLQACSTWSHFKPVKALLFLCTTGIIALRACHETK